MFAFEPSAFCILKYSPCSSILDPTVIPHSVSFVIWFDNSEGDPILQDYGPAGADGNLAVWLASASRNFLKRRFPFGGLGYIGLVKVKQQTRGTLSLLRLILDGWSIGFAEKKRTYSITA